MSLLQISRFKQSRLGPKGGVAINPPVLAKRLLRDGVLLDAQRKVVAVVYGFNGPAPVGLSFHETATATVRVNEVLPGDS